MPTLTDRTYRFIKGLNPPCPEFYIDNVVVHETPLMKLRRFRLDPTSSSTLVIPPDAGHDSTIASQAPGKSIVETIIDSKRSGSVYCIEWLPATQDTKNTSIADVIAEIGHAVNACSGAGPLHIVGLCAGAWKSAIFTALNPERVSRLSIIGGPIDFHIGGGHLFDLVKKTPQSKYEAAIRAMGGVMRGDVMLAAWKSMHIIDRYIVDHQRLWNATGNDESYAKIMLERAWYENPQDIPGAWYLEAVDNLFRKNKLVSGELYIDGRRVVLERITCPIDVINGDQDEITHIPHCFALADYVSTPAHLITRTVLEGVGHIGSFVSSSVQPVLKGIFSTIYN
jgi:poly(3-hydroxybutyrate) depolymerase